MRIAILGLALIPAEAFADIGLHQHPHGIGYGWIIACAVGVCGGYALSFGKRREK